MSNCDQWNSKLKTLKTQYRWLTNDIIAKALWIQVSRVNAWTKFKGPKCDRCFYEMLEMKLKSGALTEFTHCTEDMKH